MLSPNSLVLLHALLDDLPGDHHHLTLHSRFAMSTVIVRRGEGFEVGYPQVVERLCAAITGGAIAALILRTRTERISHTLPNGVDVPISLVMGWRVDEHTLHPLDEAQMFDAHCIDAASGEPIPPERGVEYTSAITIDLSPLHGPRPT